MADPPNVTEFAAQFMGFLEAMREAAPARPNEIRALVADYLGVDPMELPVLTETFEVTDHPNLQLALNELAGNDADARIVGLPSELGRYAGFSFSAVLGGRLYVQMTPSAVEYVNVRVDVDRTLPCAKVALHLFEVDGTRLALLGGVYEHTGRPQLSIELLTAHPDRNPALLGRIRALMHEHNVYRGKLLSFTFTEYGRFGLDFHRIPEVRRDDVVLPEDDLAAVERHAVDIGDRADALRATGRHVKRGLLLYGPPGTGKTLTVMYLCGRMEGRTTLLLAGNAALALGQAAALARSLQPAMLVIEDVDLVAHERTMPGMGTNPVLFQLLNEMDGLAEDADVLFVLTTNRVELLEPALAARPGRIDQAVEIKLPDADARRRLLELYLRGLDAAGLDLARVVARTEGVSAAFMRELVRRAVLQSDDARHVTAASLESALDDLLDRSAPIVRSILGASPGPDAGR